MAGLTAIQKRKAGWDKTGLQNHQQLLLRVRQAAGDQYNRERMKSEL